MRQSRNEIDGEFSKIIVTCDNNKQVISYIDEEIRDIKKSKYLQHTHTSVGSTRGVFHRFMAPFH